jgi:hypothetical protein
VQSAHGHQPWSLPPDPLNRRNLSPPRLACH